MITEIMERAGAQGAWSLLLNATLASNAAARIEQAYHQKPWPRASAMRRLNAIAWIATFVGVSFGLFLLLTAIDRNAQGEYINEARALDYVYAVQTFIAGFLVSAIATAALLSFVLVLVGWLFRRST
jgi:hypothetical protein